MEQKAQKDLPVWIWGVVVGIAAIVVACFLIFLK